MAHQVRNEFDALWRAQMRFNPEIFTDGLRAAIEAAAFASPRRSAGPGRSSPGGHGEMPALPSQEAVRVLFALSRLRVRQSDGAFRRLSRRERNTLANMALRGEVMTARRAGVALGLDENERISAMTGHSPPVIVSCRISAALRRFPRNGALWATLPLGSRDAILAAALGTQRTPDANLSVPAFAALARCLRMVVDQLPKGPRKALPADLGAALLFAFGGEAGRPAHSPRQAWRIARADLDRLGIVLQEPPRPPWRTHPGQSAFARLLQAMIAGFGQPDEIVFENIHAAASRRTPQRAADVAELLHRIGARATPANRRRAALWLDQRGADGKVTCPYSGLPIHPEALVGPTIEIDHIAPRSQGGSADRANTVLCHAAMNAWKGDRTPVQAFGALPTWPGIVMRAALLDPQRRDAIYGSTEPVSNTARIAETSELLRDAIETAEELAPQARFFLAPVPARPGAKDRRDLRHHGEDALELACRHAAPQREKVPGATACDEKVRADTGRLAGTWGVSLIRGCMAKHRIKLHDETPIGFRRDGRGSERFVVRTALRDLTATDLPRIADRRLRDLALAGGVQALQARCKRVRVERRLHAVDLAVVESKASRMRAHARPRVRFIDVVQMRDGTWRSYPALERDARIAGWRPIWETQRMGAKLVMRLGRGDLVALDHPNFGCELYVVTRLSPSNGVFYLAGHAQGGDLDARHRDPNDPFRWLFASVGRLREWNAFAVDSGPLGETMPRRCNTASDVEMLDRKRRLAAFAASGSPSVSEHRQFRPRPDELIAQ
ncbi:MAG TPA: HNH endonuclease domain-containing protein [Rhizobiaceae bacterium]|nr:HNH endonuclease domain-containing protein [Rhizobiaceae bacterium]